MNWTETTAPGGINKTVEEIAKNLSRRSHEVIVLQSNPSNLPEEELYEGFRITRVESKFENYLYGLNPEICFYLKNNIKRLNPDLIHIHGYHSLFSIGSIYTLKNMGLKVPMVFSPHLDIYRTTLAGKYLWNVYKLFGKFAFKSSDAIVSPSNFEAQKLVDDFGINKDEISIIPHGVNLMDDDEERGQNKDKEKSPNEDKSCNLLYSGHLIKRKGVSYIIESLNYLIHELNLKNVTLTIVGEGPEESSLENLSSDLKLDDNIVWKSFLSNEDYLKEIRNSDILLLLSNSEAFGITVAEALAMGTPCIVTKISALSEFTNEPGCFGVEYPPDPREVAETVLDIYQNDVKVGPLTSKIRTWDEISLDYEKLYLDLLEK